MNAILFVQLTHWQPNHNQELHAEWKRTGRWYITMNKHDKIVSPIRNVVLEGRVLEVNSNMLHPVQIVMQTKLNENKSMFVEGVVDYSGYDRLAESTYQKMVNDLLNRLRTSFDVNRTFITIV